jgi:hypothetical protein
LAPLGVDIAINEFDNGHRGVVAGAETGLHDADVAAVTGGITRSDGVEQLANGIIVADLRDRLAAGMQIAALAERDELFDDRTNFLGLRQGGHDLLMFDERSRHVGEHRLAVARGAVQLAA